MNRALWLWAVLLAAPGTAFPESDMGGMLRDLTAGMTRPDADPRVEPAALLALLPVHPAGWRRVEASSGAEQVLAARVVKAAARYEGAAGARLTIEIADWGGQARTAWTRMGLEAIRGSEGPRGYDRTAEVEGWPAVEQFDRSRLEGRLHVRVEDRFIVTLTGERVREAAGTPARRAVDWKRIAALRTP